ncbi:N-acylethanolamine-hydrolyzing acid amidase [Aphelenchoides fujianensis]|nr:N-acylethanolamine-hydrolyzing acid amidase [Aphelenchoides fujianensis]
MIASGIANISGVPLEDLALLNAFYEISRFCTSILAETSDGHLLHARNLDFGQAIASFSGFQLFGGWNASTHQWRLTELLRKNSVSLDFKRNGTTLFKGTTFAGHVGLLSGWVQSTECSPTALAKGYRPNGFTLTINARIRTDFRNLLRWFAHLLQPEPHLVLWVLREALTQASTFRRSPKVFE